MSEIEEISNRNLVWFFAEELKSGDMSRFNVPMRLKLAKLGILRRKRKSHGGRLEISEYGARLLEEVKK